MNKNGYINVFDRPEIYPWPWVFADEVVTKEIGEIADGRVFSTIAEENNDGHFYHYLKSADADELCGYLVSKLTDDDSFLPEVLKNIYHFSDKLTEFCTNVPKTPASLSSDEIIEIIKNYVKCLKAVRLWGWVPPLVDGLDQPYLSNVCVASIKNDVPGISNEELNEIFSALTMPKEYSQVQMSEIDKFKLVTGIGDDELKKFIDLGLGGVSAESKKMIEHYLNEYNWISFNYEGPILSADLLRKSLSGLSVSKAKEELQNIYNKHQNAKKYAEEINNKYKLSDKTQKLLNIAAEFIFIKEYRKSVYQKSYIVMEPILAELAKRLELTVKELKFVSVPEMENAVKTGQNLKNIASSRTKYCLIVIADGGSMYYQDDEAKQRIGEFRDGQEGQQAKELSGQVAYPGHVFGTAKIVLTTKDLAKVNLGDILISSATNPDLMPAMKIAAAIVTDTGGIISHAAIVSREMHIPCVVGTKHATKVIKDGDQVEVDAKKGIVRIL